MHEDDNEGSWGEHEDDNEGSWGEHGDDNEGSWDEHKDGNEGSWDVHEDSNEGSWDVLDAQANVEAYDDGLGPPLLPPDGYRVRTVQRDAALAGPAWWTMRGPCRSCALASVPCTACIGSEADPRRHTIGVNPVTGLPVMVDCKACKAAVDAAEARGQVIVGVGLGGPGGHCDTFVQTPLATHCSAVVPLLGVALRSATTLPFGALHT